MSPVKEIPLYLFIGFLESGKTTFVQSTLEDGRFNAGERTLLLLCEEGETELVPKKFAADKVFIETIDKPEQINPDKLAALVRKHRAERVIMEYNGMWQVSDLLNAMPDGWMLAQCLCFFDGNTVELFNANMRSLVVDKLNVCDLAVFNRLPAGRDTMPLHKLVRGITRRSDIAYEFDDGNAVYDDIEDPLPFDKAAAVIDIADRDYALWYRDLSEAMADYDGKTVAFLGVVAADKKMPAGQFFLGRHVMTCCQDDIAYNGLLTKWDDPAAKQLQSYDWVRVTAKIALEKNRYYRSKGPVLTVLSLAPADKPEQPVATFY